MFVLKFLFQNALTLTHRLGLIGLVFRVLFVTSRAVGHGGPFGKLHKSLTRVYSTDCYIRASRSPRTTFLNQIRKQSSKLRPDFPRVGLLAPQNKATRSRLVIAFGVRGDGSWEVFCTLTNCVVPALQDSCQEILKREVRFLVCSRCRDFFSRGAQDAQYL